MFSEQNALNVSHELFIELWKRSPKNTIRKGWYVTAALALMAAIISGLIVGNFTSKVESEQKTITSSSSQAAPTRDVASDAP